MPSGRVKSIRQSAPASARSNSEWITTPVSWPEKAPASLPMKGEPATSRAPDRVASGAAAMASISMRPMRPLAPATAIFNCVMTYCYWMLELVGDAGVTGATARVGAFFFGNLLGPAMRSMYSRSVGRLPPSKRSTTLSLK